jgi:eukaryotic-like serine/threonine-protein kinase
VATSDDPNLLSIASLISEGARVDWSRLQRQTSDPYASTVLDEMALLEEIARFHRGTPASDGSDDDRDADTHELQAWGHFTVIERIGGGAFGTVYRVKDTKLQSEAALKLLSPRASEADLHSAQKEARLLARLRHPNVVAVHGTDCIEGRVGIWMEFVQGRTLAALLRDQGPFGAREAAIIGFDLCRALSAVHRAGLLHGDLKANNVMREHGGRTVLMDFGTGKDLAGDLENEPPRSDFAGTPLYVAPEVFEGRPRTKLADIYSLGVLLFQMVTESYPVGGRTRAEVAQAHRRGERIYLRDARSDLPAEFVAVVERALSVDPRDRYQSAGAFEAALAPIIGRAPDEEPRRRRGWIAMAVSAAGVLAVAAGLAYWASSRPLSGRSGAESTGHDATSAGATASSSAASAADSSYQIDAALYRVRGTTETRLRPGGRIAPGDNLFAKIRVSVPAYVYIVNEDDLGESFLLFPLAGQTLGNPLVPGTTHRIPGAEGNEEINWQVTSAGGREHFLIFASPEQLPAFDKMFAVLPKPERGRQVQNARLSQEMVRRLRSVGGLTSSAVEQTAAGRLTVQFPTPLGDSEETARGLWVRQFTVENPR